MSDHASSSTVAQVAQNSVFLVAFGEGQTGTVSLRLTQTG